MIFKSTDSITFQTAQRCSVYHREYSGESHTSQGTIYGAEFQGDGALLNRIKIKLPQDLQAGQTYQLLLTIAEKQGSSWITFYSENFTVQGEDADTLKTYQLATQSTLDPAQTYRTQATIDNGSSHLWPYSQNSGYYIGEALALPVLDLEGDSFLPECQDDIPTFNLGQVAAGAYVLRISKDNFKTWSTMELQVGGWVDLIDASMTSRASASVEPKVDSILSELQDSGHGLEALQTHMDQQDQVSAGIRDSLGTPGSGEGSVHAKLGPYSGAAGDNNNVKDDIGSLSVVGATVKDVWSYAPDGSEGSGSTADLLERSTDASEDALAELQDGTHGLDALRALDQDALDRIGDTQSTDLVARLVDIMAELQSSQHGLDILKAALDALQEDVGDPSDSGTTLEALLNTSLDELQDPGHGLGVLAMGHDTLDSKLDSVRSTLGSAGDDSSSGTIWGDINDMQDSLAGAHGKLDSILSELQSSTHGLAVIQSALDHVLNNQGDVDTYGTLTAQSQAIKAMLEDASSGLQAIKGQVDAVINVLGSPALGTISQDIADNKSALVQLQADMTTGLSELQDILDHIGDTQSTDLVERLQSISTTVGEILTSLGTPTIAGASVHAKLGQDYDGVYTEEDGMLKTGHRVIDDLQVIMDTLLHASFPGSGAYLNTQGGYYANDQFYPVGTGPVVDEQGVPLGGVRVSAFMDRDGDGIFEALIARAYTDGSGLWQMALDSGVYLLTFYLPGALLVYEWRVVDPDGSGLEPPDEAPDGGHLPGGGVGLI